MGSLPGSNEIVESDMDGGGSGVDEKVGKLPKLKTGRNCGLEDDLNHIFEAIDRRTAARNLVMGVSAKNALKRPVRVGASQASGIGVSESVSLKQALRGLCISHASEMATMKRSSKVIGVSEVSEAGALERMYRSVVVEANTSDLPLDERKGNLVEISLVPEKSESSSSDKFLGTVQVHKKSSFSPRAESSTQFAVPTSTNAKLTNTIRLDESTTNSAETRERTPSMGSKQERKLKCPSSVSSSDTANEAPELTKVGRKTSSLELVRKGQLQASVHSSSSSKTASKGNNSASNSPRLFIPATAKPTTPKMQPQYDIASKPTSSSKVSKSPCNSPRLLKPIVTNGINAQPIASKTQSQDELLKNSAGKSPRLFMPVTARPTTPKMLSQKNVVPTPASTSKVSKSPCNSPRLIKPVVTNGISAIPKLSKAQSQDEIVQQSASAVDQRSMLRLPPKGNLKRVSSPSFSSTIRKVLEIEEIDPASEEVMRETSTPKVVLKNEVCPAPSSRVSDSASKISKFGSSSPRVMNLVSKHTKYVKNKIKRGKSSASSSSNACSGIKTEGFVPDTSDSVCQTHKSNQKSMKKESASTASTSRSLSVEVSLNNIDSASSNRVIDSNSCDDKAISGSASGKTRLKEKGNISQSSKSTSIGEYSSSTSISEDSSLSASSCSTSRPHMSTDSRWDAIRLVKTRYGSLGLKNFKLLKRLGCGDIGTVYLAGLTGTNCLFALKVMDSQFLASRRKLPRAQTEREILQMLDHPFLPTLYAHFTTEKFSCLVMEYCPGGDLHVVRQKQPNRSFSEHAARFYVAEVLLALEYLHMLGVVYRDLKPENILVREDGHIMLSDFDLSLRCVVNPSLLKSSSSDVEPAKKLSGPCAEATCIDPFCIQPSWSQVSCFSPRLISGTAKTRKLKADLANLVRPLPQVLVEPTSARSNSFVGTHEYLAPEIIKGDGHGSAVDWWTFGIFLYELLFGRTPFKGAGNEETLVNVVLQSLKFPENPVVSFQAKDLIRGLLVKEPENRFGSIKGAAEIKQHPFFEGLNWALIRCAVPPELPKCCDPVSRSVDNMAYQKEDITSSEFRHTGEQIGFELF